jgi:ubiquinone biosynthesis accessory factor UbiJ
MKLDPAALPSDIVNRLLAREAWARDKLAAHAGRIFAVTVGPATAGFRIAADGSLENAPLAGALPDLHLTLSPLNLTAFLADPRQWNEWVIEEGDADLGGTLKELAQTLPWFVEQAFAHVLGPIAGQRAADAGRRLLGFPGYAAQRVSEGVARYARDETDLLARGDEFRAMTAQVDDLAIRVDGLSTRVVALTERMSGVRPV